MSSPTTTLPLTYPDWALGPNGDLDPLGGETKSDFQNLVQDVGHILVENLSSNLDDPNRGVGIFNYLSADGSKFQQLSKLIEAQLRDDPRISSVSCIITANNPQGQFPYSIVILIGVGPNVIPINFQWGPVAGLQFIG